MARLCERPGCSVPADVSYGFDAEQLVVWLDGFRVAQGAKSGVLCRRHADAMVVPLGWMLDDRREPTPRLFRPPAEAPTGPMIRPRVRRVRPDPTTRTVQLQLDEYGASSELASAVEQAVTEAIAIAQHADASHDAELAELTELAALVQLDQAVESPQPVEVVEPATAERDAERDAEHVAEHVAEREPDDVDDESAEVLPWQPVFDERDDLQGLLKARGRLLSRAFNGIAADDH
jgi:hypothetical protein